MTKKAIKPNPSPQSPVLGGEELSKQTEQLLRERGAAILVSRVCPQLDTDIKLMNEEIEVLYEYVTHRYAIPLDMLIVLFGVAIQVGHESFVQSQATKDAPTPKATLTKLLHDLIEQYEEGRKRQKVH